MKIQIKNYKTLRDAEIVLKKNEINYIIGSNESGKTNLMEAIRAISKNDSIKIDLNSATVINSIPRKMDEVEFFIFDSESKYKNKISSSREHVWLGKDLEYYEEYKTLVNDKKEKINQIKNLVTNTIANMEPGTKGIVAWKQLNAVLAKILTFDLLSTDEQSLLMSADTKLMIKNQYLAIEELLKFYSKIRIIRPNVIFRQPMENAFKKEKIKYPWMELEQSDSLLRKMIKSFSDDETLKTLDDIFKLQGQEDDNKRRIKNRLIDSLNNQVKNYFDNELSILKGHPKFSSEGSEIVLDIEPNSKISLDVDNGNEDSRSLGFKSFVRIVLEMKMLSKVKDDVIYLIDEPEQGLHPFLQELLMKELKKIVANKDNGLTILIASHSPYIVQFEENEFNKYFENLNFILRNQVSDSKLKSGETIIRNLNDQKFFEDMLAKWANSYSIENQNHLDEEVFLYRMVMDSGKLSDFNKALKNQITKLHKDLSEKNINRKTFDDEIKKLSLIKENSKK